MSDEAEISHNQKPAKYAYAWRWISLLLAACALALGAYAVNVIVSYQHSNNQILQQIKANPPHTTRDLLCVSLKLQTAVGEGADVPKELQALGISPTYCNAFRFKR